MNPATTAPQLRYLDELYLSAWRNTAKQFRESRVFKIVATGGDNDCLIDPVQIQVTLDIDCRCCGFMHADLLDGEHAPDFIKLLEIRLEERREGKEGVITCRSRWLTYH